MSNEKPGIRKGSPAQDGCRSRPEAEAVIKPMQELEQCNRLPF